MADKDTHQHVAEGEASDRVAEKAAEINARLKARPDQDAEALAIEPPAKTRSGKVAAKAK